MAEVVLSIRELNPLLIDKAGKLGGVMVHFKPGLVDLTKQNKEVMLIFDKRTLFHFTINGAPMSTILTLNLMDCSNLMFR